MNRIAGLLILMAVFVVRAEAATKVVAASGGDYTTLQAAVADFANWADGTDRIQVKDDQITILTTTLRLKTLNAASSLVVENFAGASPVIAASASTIPTRLIDPSTSGTFTLSGLTLLGPAGTSGVQTAIRAEAPNADMTKVININNCVLTANNGSNAPLTTWGSAATGSVTVGNCDYLILNGDDPYKGKLTVNVNNSTLAFARLNNNGQDAALLVQRQRDAAAAPDAYRVFNLQNTLIINNRLGGVGSRDTEADTTISLKNCAVFKSGGRGMRMFRNNIDIAPNVVLDHTIVAQAVNESCIGLVNFRGKLVLNRVTLGGPVNIGVYVENGVAGLSSFQFSDVIFATASQPFRMQPDETAPASFTLSSGAVVTPATLNTGNAAVIEAAFSGLYSGAGPVTVDPSFASTNLAVLDGVVGWNSGNNTLYDVTDLGYANKSAVGAPFNALSGGADPSGALPVELSSMSVE